MVKKKQKKKNKSVCEKNSVYKEIINKLNLLKLQNNILKQNYFKEKSLKVFFQKKCTLFNFKHKNKYFMWPRTAIGRELPYLQWSV